MYDCGHTILYKLTTSAAPPLPSFTSSPALCDARFNQGGQVCSPHLLTPSVSLFPCDDDNCQVFISSHTLFMHSHYARSTTQHHAASRSITQHHAAPRNTTQYHPASRSTTHHHATLHLALLLCSSLMSLFLIHQQATIECEWETPPAMSVLLTHLLSPLHPSPSRCARASTLRAQTHRERRAGAQ